MQVIEHTLLLAGQWMFKGKVEGILSWAPRATSLAKDQRSEGCVVATVLLAEGRLRPPVTVYL